MVTGNRVMIPLNLGQQQHLVGHLQQQHSQG